MSVFQDFGRGVLTQVVTGGLRKVSGNLPGMLGLSGGKTSRSLQASLTNVSSRHKVDALQFPLDVISDTGLGNHGHYIMFYINAQEDAELTSEKIDQNAKGSVADDPTQQYDVPKFLRKYDEVRNKIVEVENTGGRENQVDKYGGKSSLIPNLAA